MTTDEMIEILEGIIRDKETNATARCTAIRTLMQIEDDAGSRELDEKCDTVLGIAGARPHPAAVGGHREKVARPIPVEAP